MIGDRPLLSGPRAPAVWDLSPAPPKTSPPARPLTPEEQSLQGTKRIVGFGSDLRHACGACASFATVVYHARGQADSTEQVTWCGRFGFEVHARDAGCGHWGRKPTTATGQLTG